jgi:hypothetical protein
LTGPDTVSGNGQKDLPLLGQDRDGHDVVENGSNDGSHDLRHESLSGRDLQVDTELQIFQQGDGLDLRVVTVHGTVHVGYRVTGQDVGSQHLIKTGSSRYELRETEGTGQETVDGGELKKMATMR